MSTVGDGRELTLPPVLEIGALLKMLENGIVSIGMRSKELLMTLLLSHLQGVNMGLLCSEFCLCFCEVSGEAIEVAELSCDSPVPMLQGVGLHCIIAGGIAQHVKEPLGVLPLFVNGETLQCKEFLSVNWFPFSSCPKAVLPIKEDVGCEDINGVGAISDWKVKIGYFPFIFFEILGDVGELIINEPLVTIFFPVEVGCLQDSCMCLALCQSFSLLSEYFKLFAVLLGVVLILSHNSIQSLCDEEELVTVGVVPFESSADGSRG